MTTTTIALQAQRRARSTNEVRFERAVVVVMRAAIRLFRHRTASALFGLGLAVVVGCSGAPASGAPDAGAATPADASAATSADAAASAAIDAALPPTADAGSGPSIVYTRKGIELVSTDQVTDPNNGITYHRAFYRNMAYRCGRTGYYTFVVLEPPGVTGTASMLWVVMHGGGNGYYGSDGNYHPGSENDAGTWVAPGEHENDEWSAKQLTQAALKSTPPPNARILGLHMCDHDLYSGIGEPYPNDPNPGRTDDRVEGLIASISAIVFTASGNGITGAGHLDGYPTTYVFLHGTSAGSVGAYSVSSGLARLGIFINGALLDSALVTTRSLQLYAAKCTPNNKKDPTFDVAQVLLKEGPFISDPSLYIENNVAGPYDIPYLFMDGTLDPFCCGNDPPIAAATAAGFTNNCKYNYDVVKQAFANSGNPLDRYLMLEGAGHVVIGHAAARAAAEQWVQDVLATNPAPPVFPK